MKSNDSTTKPKNPLPVATESSVDFIVVGCTKLWPTELYRIDSSKTIKINQENVITLYIHHSNSLSM